MDSSQIILQALLLGFFAFSVLGLFYLLGVYKVKPFSIFVPKRGKRPRKISKKKNKNKNKRKRKRVR